MLYGYTFFHLNLAYSAISQEDHSEVIDRCYWPLLNLVKHHQIPLGIELPGFTLERIAELDPNWVTELKNLIHSGKCDLIGCGYSQQITPLLPYEVNKKNYQIGNKIYEIHLNTRPTLALVSEQVYSSSIIEILEDEGVNAIVMEWNNPFKANDCWDTKLSYLPQMVANTQGDRGLPIIWNESIAFQKFQRYAHGEIGIEDLLEYTL